MEYEQKYMFPELRQKIIDKMISAGGEQLGKTDLYGTRYLGGQRRGRDLMLFRVDEQGREILYLPIFSDNRELGFYPSKIDAITSSWDRWLEVPTFTATVYKDKTLLGKICKKPGRRVVLNYSVGRDVVLGNCANGVSLIDSKDTKSIEEQLEDCQFSIDPRADGVFRRRVNLEDGICEFVGIVEQGNLLDIYQGDWNLAYPPKDSFNR